MDGQNDADPARNHLVIDSLSYEAPTGHDVNPIDMAGDFGSDKFLDNATDEIDDVFMAAQPGDPISGLNNWGSPYGHQFGAQQLGTHDPGGLHKMSEHSKYFLEKQSLLVDIAAAITDQR